jgi:hypothetical protein
MDRLKDDQKNWLSLLGLLEILQRFGNVKQPERGKVIPFPAKGGTKIPSPKTRANSPRVLHGHHTSAGKRSGRPSENQDQADDIVASLLR